MNRQHGFGAIAAIVVLVILAVLSAAIVSVGSTQQMTSAQDVLSARAWQAARAGNEWGLYQALRTTGTWYVGAAGDPCPAGGALGHGTQASQTLDLTTETGFRVTVTGDCWRYNEGESVPGTPQTVGVYTIRAVACPAAACPATDAMVAGAGYVERTRAVIATN
ncbi:MAG: prepilin-type N-terminal cleavage/methylation domain-containing protein [Sulfurisoma sp.]|nr:prepilin-type N-terminal cleavage/methylation domain-containing protein [Sulfurisoma sp.]